MVKKIGLIGLTEGNGHPYSWGSIINGYNDSALKASNWNVIYNYVSKRDISEFGFYGVKITHVWTQDHALSENLRDAINAEKVVLNYEDMISEVDAVIIARDDYENHLKMAKPFLEAGLKVLIDKPLTLDIDELLFFKSYLEKGQLMSVAGLRFAIELDDVRVGLESLGKLNLIQSTVVNDWEKYGIHLIDGVLGVLDEKPVAIECVSKEPENYIVHFNNDLKWSISILGQASKTFNLTFIGDKNKTSVDIEDNFSMFRRMLYRFVKLLDSNECIYPYENTLISISLLISGRQSKLENKIVYLDELYALLGLEEN